MADVGRWMRVGRRLVRFELLLYAATVRWIARRRAVPAGADAWGYGRLVSPMLWLWVFGSAVETVAFHLLIPWEGVRLAVDIVSIWGLIWMLGMLAGYQVYPHLVTDDEIRVRSGVYHDIRVPRALTDARFVCRSGGREASSGPAPGHSERAVTPQNRRSAGDMAPTSRRTSHRPGATWSILRA